MKMQPRTWMLRPVNRAVMECVSTVERLAFWAAVALPLSYLAFVAAARVWALDATVLVALLAANAVALVVGHRYEPAASSAADSA